MAKTQASQKSMQVNIRFERELKRRGEEAFRRAGYSSSEATRLFWEFAAQQQDNPKALRAFLDEISGVADSETQERKRKIEALQQLRRFSAEVESRYGIDGASLKDAGDSELLPQALYEQAMRGQTDRAL